MNSAPPLVATSPPPPGLTTASSPTTRTLVLGSTSPYRRELLARLRIPFEVAAPEVDETPLTGESPRALAERLALVKARVVASAFPHAVVIGADQVADLNGLPLGKPGDHPRASKASGAVSAASPGNSVTRW